jgi:hypothetical protein
MRPWCQPSAFLRQIPRARIDQAIRVEHVEHGAGCGEPCLDILVRIFGTKIAAAHCITAVRRRTRLLPGQVVRGQSRTNGAAGIPCSGL